MYPGGTPAQNANRLTYRRGAPLS
ncbi:hypothetical protein SPHINGO391_390386 [Sphingomonas aurantiaca]|uniref:Uncharacterized protein n=1 Tax=Sphingomonas aurantiaca TaxID=185949 RepID=A0A5E7YUH0_9SPHN|nr:hypothetical protein SPHINGO391_390386 [Sphingomonas aurantiaca]